jgi:hypothetical protein
MRRCLHLTHKAFSCMENNRKLVRLVKTHKKVCGTTGWEFSLDLLMDTHSLLRSLHQQKGLLRIVLAKRIMKWWVPMKLLCEISSCYAQVAITNTVGLYPTWRSLQEQLQMELPCEKEKKPYKKLRAIQDHTPRITRQWWSHQRTITCMCTRETQEGIRESDDQDSRGVHKIN